MSGRAYAKVATKKENTFSHSSESNFERKYYNGSPAISSELSNANLVEDFQLHVDSVDSEPININMERTPKVQNSSSKH